MNNLGQCSTSARCRRCIAGLLVPASSRVAESGACGSCRPPWRGRARENGSALLAALCFASVLGIALASYTALCQRTLEMSTRALHGSRCVELTDTGMEEALWAMNKNTWTGWTITGTTATKTLTGFTFENGVTGEVRLTVETYNSSTGTRRVTVSGIAHVPNVGDITRTLTSTSVRAPLFVNAIAATNGTVSFSSGGGADSYDSGLGTYASQTPTFSAVIASEAEPSTSANILLTNAQIKGYVASRYSGGPSFSTNAKVIGPSTPLTTKIDWNRIVSSPYQPVFAIRTISGTGSTLANPPLGSTTTIGSPTDTVPAIYYCTGLDLTGTTKIIVDGPVQLVVSGAFYIGLNGGANTASIELSATGSLEVFVAGDIAIYGNGIRNVSQDPRRLAVFGTNSLTVPDMNTTVPYHGVIYTPRGNFTVAANSVIYGALVAKKVSCTGTAPALHYDLRLRRTVFSGIDTPFAVLDWRESTAGG